MLFVCTSGQPECPNIIYIILYYLIIYFTLPWYIATCTVYTTQCKLLERKYGICASGWKEKHHQRKLQWVKPPRVQVEYLCQLLREKHHHRKDKVQRSGCWWSAQCSNHCNLRKGTQFKFLPCPVLRNLNCVPLRKLQ